MIISGGAAVSAIAIAGILLALSARSPSGPSSPRVSEAAPSVHPGPPATGKAPLSVRASATPRRTPSPSSNLILSATVASSTAATAQFVDFTIRVEDPDSGYVAVGLMFRDGRSRPLTTRWTGREMGAGKPAPPVGEVLSATHAFRTPGRYEVSIKAYAGYAPCGWPHDYAETRVNLDITPGETPSNGPRDPSALMAHYVDTHHPPPTFFYLTGTDEDGWISRMLVDWGDGITQVFVYPIPNAEIPAQTGRTLRVPNVWSTAIWIREPIKRSSP